MGSIADAVRQELTQHIIPFWKGLKDDVNGGFISLVDTRTLERFPMADKGCILNSRILWFFSEAAMQLEDDSLCEYAHHAFEMLKRMTDTVNGGMYWSLKADGSVSDSTKHTYNQAFAIYALSAYYRLTGRKEALKRATDLFELIETRCRDEGGYLEAFTADFRPESNEKLSENGVMAVRTMNTLLHVLEGYTGLYQASRLPEVKAKLIQILEIFEKHIYNPEKRRQEVFFDHEYRSLIDLHSFGHDIETSWLAGRTLEVLEDEEITSRIQPLLIEMADNTYSAAFTESGFMNESECGKVDASRVWWVQAEALLGFLNAWRHTKKTYYLDAASDMWNYIASSIIDPRPGSEWFWQRNADGTKGEREIVNEWKCPYHNGRMCLEVLRLYPEL